MRIVAGRLRGRRLESPAGKTTRPTTDRVRESVFSALVSIAGQDLGGGPVLDAFAGSGALGLEALSRGAGPVTFIERDRAAYTTLRKNVDALGVTGSCALHHADTFAIAKRLTGARFALILLDPPYTLDTATVGQLLFTLQERGALAEDALVTWEHASSDVAEWPVFLEPVVSKTFGSTTVEIARVTGGEVGT